MSLRHYGFAAIAALTISACSSDDQAPAVAGAGAGTNAGANAGQGGEAGANAGRSGTSAGAAGTEAGQGGMSAGAGQGGASGGAGAGAMSVTGGIGGSGGTAHDAGVDAGSDAGPALEGCVVATRLDHCCPMWAAVSRADAYADPCVLAIGEPLPASVVVTQECTPQICTDVLCIEQPPPSRVAEPFGPNGECIFVDECHAEATCEVGFDVSRCCPCPTSMPSELLAREPCLVGESEANSAPQSCVSACAVPCGVCPDLAVPSCAIGGAPGACL